MLFRSDCKLYYAYGLRIAVPSLLLLSLPTTWFSLHSLTLVSRHGVHTIRTARATLVRLTLPKKGLTEGTKRAGDPLTLEKGARDEEGQAIGRMM